MVKNLYFLSKTKILTILYKSKDLKAQLLNILNYSKLSIAWFHIVPAGSHTIGQARCTNFRAHIYNETNIDSGFAMSRQSGCPRSSGSGDNNLAPLDLQTPTVFENNYYKNLVVKKGLLHSDQELFNGGATDALVQSYISSQSTFFADFVTGMIKMGDITPLTGSNGEIRKNCRRIN